MKRKEKERKRKRKIKIGEREKINEGIGNRLIYLYNICASFP